ncbi:NAD(P)-dependent oxidoreductase [Actibacterium sp. D379-3]
MPIIHVTEPIHADALALLDGAATVQRGWLGQGDMAQADAWLVRTQRITGAAINAAPGLRIISKHGVGVDNIAVEAAAARGVVVANTPGANAGAVAEHTLMLILALARRALPLDRAARDGFAGRDRIAPMDLDGKRVLLAGYGAIAQRVAQLCAAFGMQVTVWHRRLDAAGAGFPVTRDLRAALPQADILSLHLPLNAGTRGLIGAAELALLPPGALLINTGRGGVVDEAALMRAAPRLGGIGLDVFATEPLPKDSPLLTLPDTLFSPHAAGMSAGAMRAMGMQAAQNVLDHFAGCLAPAARVTPA